ncbi:MAG: neutral/alkaline non-lysosomal ceramidase N-terminal domain-containing protein [Clostridia bacterium]|nr:neutral/alkaline non-lysosomal ceramidase N-terminal domain-containing protein [Clostridia bacterium]
MFKSAFYEKEITPPLGCHIPGYFNIREGSDVKDRLCARACVISDGSETVALIAIDACAIAYEVREMIANRVSAFTGIKPENVLVAATHSHTGIPMYGFDRDEKVAENQKGYFDVMPKLVADCAILAYKRLEESEISYNLGSVDGISFCRDYEMKNSTPRTNPGRLNPDIVGPMSKTDNELPVLFFKDAEGTPKGAIISFACHLDCVDGTEYSGDFASELSLQMKKLYGQDFVTVFFMGTSGDINHFNVKTAGDAPDHYRKMGRKIAGEALRLMAFAEPVADSGIRCNFELMKINRRFISEEKIAEAKHNVATIKEAKGIKLAADGTAQDQYDLAMSKRLLDFIATNPEVFDVPVHYIQIGDVKFFGLSSEIFCHFGLSLKEQCGTNKRFVASQCNASLGYVPTRDMFYDTIYESKPGSNRLETEAGYMMVEKLLEMSK